jgi:hypothetical protein
VRHKSSSGRDLKGRSPIVRGLAPDDSNLSSYTGRRTAEGVCLSLRPAAATPHAAEVLRKSTTDAVTQLYESGLYESPPIDARRAAFLRSVRPS